MCQASNSDAPKDAKNEQPKRVNNTIIPVQSGKGQYILNASSLLGSIKWLIGFLLRNGLSKKQIVIFTDDAREIHNTIQKMLHFMNYQIILDWYHLKKKFKEQLSMALNGSKIRNLGEKANDIVVSSRQKHNGMSWSNNGSVAFASVASASHNLEIETWVHTRNINLELRTLDKAA